jgi:rSAM/selenodomain-associated transferase 1
MEAVVIMAKEPKPNKVKTRLIPPLKPESAADLYHNFLLDKIEQVRSLEGIHPYTAYMPKSSEAFFREIVPGNFFLLLQVGSDLGERLAYVSNRLFDIGYKKIIMLDSDTPNLPTNYIREGFKRLSEFDVIIGPSEDGGYYLIGLKSKNPELFSDIPWSTPGVTEKTLEKTSSMGLKTSLLEKWYDVDTLDALKRLKSDLDKQYANGKEDFCCENTLKAVSKILPELLSNND